MKIFLCLLCLVSFNKLLTAKIQIIFLSFSFGILCHFAFNFSWVIIYTILIGAILAILLIDIFSNQDKLTPQNLFQKNLAIYLLLFGIFMTLGFWQATRAENSSKILFEDKKSYTFTGQISAEPENREFNKRLKFSPDGYDETIILSTTLSANFHYGDKVEVTTTLQKPENFESDKGIEFDYVNFLGKDQIFYQAYYPRIRLVESDKSFFGFLFKFKKDFMSEVNQILPSPQAELVGGILLGLKSSLGKQLELDFRRVGLIHIVVLSGYNVTIIAGQFWLCYFFCR